jgi:MFS family permease
VGSSSTSASPPDRSLALVSFVMGASFITQTILALAVPLYALQLGASVAAIGLLVSLPFWLPTILAIPIGRVVSRVGARRIMLGGAVGMTLAPWFTVAFPGVPGLVATQMLIGVSQISMGISAQSTVAAVGQRGSLERAFGWYTTSVSVGQLVGPFLAGVLLERLAASATFAVAGVVPLSCLLAAWALPPQPPLVVGVRRSLLGYGDQLRLLQRNVGVQMALLITLAMLFGFASHAAFFPVYLRGLEVPATLIGALMSVRALASTVIRPLMPLLVRRLGSRSRTALAAMAVAAVAFGLTGLGEQIVVLALLAAALGLAVGVAQPLAMVVLADHVDPSDRPAALGFRLTVNQAAQVVGPLLLGSLAHWVGLGPMFLVGGLMLVAVAGVARRLRSTFDVLEATKAHRATSSAAP